MEATRLTSLAFLLGLIVCSTVPSALPQENTKSPPAKSGKVLDLVFRVDDLQGKVQDLKGTVNDLAGKAQNLNGAVTDLAGKVQSMQVKESALEIHIELAADVLFDFDKYSLRPIARDTLHKAALIITDKAKGVVKIDGYTDAKGSDSYNQRLSERRANAVKDWFSKQEKLSNIQFQTQGFGPKNPVAPNKKPNGSDDPVGRQKNRRVEITIKK